MIKQDTTIHLQFLEIGHVKASRLIVDIQEHRRELSATRMQPALVMTLIRQNYPRVNARMNQMYNLMKAIRREEIDGRSAIDYCLYLTAKHNYVAQTDMNSDGQLTGLLIAYSTSIQFIRTQPYVVLINTMYKTNNKWPECEIVVMTPINHNLVALYPMRDEVVISYTQVMKRLRDILGDVQTPNVIMTDRAEGLCTLKMMWRIW